MRVFATILIIGSVGCTGGDGTDTFTHPFESQHTNTDPTPTETETTDPGTTPGTTPDGLNGQVPAVALPPPDFSQVVARNGTLASPAALVGRPTVLWFYPAAFTGG